MIKNNVIKQMKKKKKIDLHKMTPSGIASFFCMYLPHNFLVIKMVQNNVMVIDNKIAGMILKDAQM